MTSMQMTLWHTRGNGDWGRGQDVEKNTSVKYVGTAGQLPAEVWCQSNKKIETAADLKELQDALLR